MTEQKTITFYDDELTAVQLEGGDIYVPVRRLCDNLGLDWAGQRQRINRDEVLSEAIRGVGVITTPHDADQHGGTQEMLCLPLDLVPGWLFGVSTARVKDEIRPKLLRYRRECFKVLWNAFKADILPSIPAGKTMAEKTLAQAEAIYHMARQQVALERWLANHDDRLDTVEGEVVSLQESMQDIQLRVYGPHQLISEAQAAEISQAVKTVAFAMTKKRPDHHPSWYQTVYALMYREYGITSYKRVPASKFGEVIEWLENLESLFGEAE